MRDLDTSEGAVWEVKTRVESRVLKQLAFKHVDMNHPVFVDTRFEDCTFEQALFHDARLYNCDFTRCRFVNVDLRGATIGAHGGLYRDCAFVRCDFRGAPFYCPHFDRCLFDRCKWKRIEFNDSSFAGCRFVGKMEDVTFNGMHHEQSTGFAPLERVDFSDAILGEFVSFDDCDLSTCIPPRGCTFDALLYALKPSRPTLRSTGSKDRIVLTG